MSQRVARFDPSVGSGDCTIGATNRCSKIWVVNESPNFITLDFGGAASTEDLQPFYNQLITLQQPANMAHWTVTDTLQSGSTPISLVIIRLYQPAEDTSSLLSGPIPRLLNVGNAAAVSASASAVQNDGNPAGTTLLEGTPSGAGASQALITNDGKATLGGGNLKIDATGKFTSLPAGAVPVASIGAGALPSGTTVPAGQITGSVPSAASAASLSGSIGANQVNPGSFPAGTFTLQKLALSGGGGVTGLAQITGSGSATVNTGISGLQAVVLNTFNNSNSTTYGSGSYTISTCFVYQFNPQPWVGLVFNN